MKFSITSLLVSALAVGLAQAGCTTTTPCSPDSVCQALISSPGQVCGTTQSASGCSLSGGAVTCDCC